VSAILLLLVCLVAGIVLRQTGRLPDDAPTALNAYVINLALPALALAHLHRTELTPGLLASAAGAWLMLGAAALVIGVAARRMNLGPGATGALILTGGLANTSFIGLPMIEAWIGHQGLPYGIVIDQLGSYLALSTFGLLVAARYSSQSMHWGAMWKRVVTFPPLIALVVALVLRPVAFPDALSDALLRIGGTVAPVALLAVGCQLRLGDFATNRRALALGLGYKLVLGPLLVAAVCLALVGARTEDADLARTVVVFEAAMGPMIGAAVVANHYKLDRAVASLMIGIGIPLSLVIAPLWLNVAQTMA
jgi:malate permease and related proteins